MQINTICYKKELYTHTFYMRINYVRTARFKLLWNSKDNLTASTFSRHHLKIFLMGTFPQTCLAFYTFHVHSFYPLVARGAGDLQKLYVRGELECIWSKRGWHFRRAPKFKEGWRFLWILWKCNTIFCRNWVTILFNFSFLNVSYWLPWHWL